MPFKEMKIAGFVTPCARYASLPNLQGSDQGGSQTANMGSKTQTVYEVVGRGKATKIETVLFQRVSS